VHRCGIGWRPISSPSGISGRGNLCFDEDILIKGSFLLLLLNQGVESGRLHSFKVSENSKECYWKQDSSPGILPVHLHGTSGSNNALTIVWDEKFKIWWAGS
jgi:hypothetical protein